MTMIIMGGYYFFEWFVPFLQGQSLRLTLVKFFAMLVFPAGIAFLISSFQEVEVSESKIISRLLFIVKVLETKKTWALKHAHNGVVITDGKKKVYINYWMTNSHRLLEMIQKNKGPKKNKVPKDQRKSS